MRNPLLLLLPLFFILPTANASAQKITRETFVVRGKTRTYYLYVPAKKQAGATMPLVLTLHGSGRDGRVLVERWKDLAEREGFILAGPDSKTSAHWSMKDDGAELFVALAEELKAKQPVNPRRVYLFGHSAGAGFALLLALFESRYFTAIVAHAGVLPPSTYPLLERAPRKTPIALYVGTQDPLFPLSAVRATRDALKQRGYAPELTEIKFHDHNYYDRAKEINQSAWGFLSRHELAEEPRLDKGLTTAQFGAALDANPPPSEPASEPPAKEKTAAAEAFERAARLYEAGDAGGAVAAYTKGLELDPNVAGAYNNRALAHSLLGNHEAAVADLTRSVELDPKLAAAYVNRGTAYRALKRYDEAVADLTKAATLAPSPEAFFNRGVTHEQKGDPDAALADYTQALALNPKLAPAYVNRGIILLQKGRESEADKDFAAGFALDPSLRGQVGDYIEQLRASLRKKRP